VSFCTLLSQLIIIGFTNIEYSIYRIALYNFIGNDFDVEFSRNWHHAELFNNFSMSFEFDVLDHFILSGILTGNSIVSLDHTHRSDILSDQEPIRNMIISRSVVHEKYIAIKLHSMNRKNVIQLSINQICVLCFRTSENSCRSHCL